MAVPTNQEMLDNLNTAINARLSGGAVQSYSHNGRNIQSFSLGDLMNLRKQLQAAVASERGDCTSYASFVRPK